MKKVVNKLLDLNLRKAQPENKDYYINDGNGLYLLVKSTGVKLWRFKYVHPITKQQKMISLGKYPIVSLADVRIKKQQFLELLNEKIDPLSFEKEEKIKKLGDEKNNLKNVFTDWIKLQHTKPVTKKHLRKVENAFTTHILNKNIELAHKQVKNIVPNDFLEIFWNILNNNKHKEDTYSRTDLIKRLCSYVNSVFNFALTKNLVEYNKMIGLKEVLPKHIKKNFPTLPPTELPNILKKINSSNLSDLTKSLMYFQLITLSRPNEAVKCEWSDIDLKTKLWTIKAEKMKMRRDHIVPLSDLAISILKDVKKSDEVKNQYVFSSKNSKTGHINLETANNALKRLGYKGILVAHGFRSIASTALNESRLFNKDTIEIALAHVDKNTIRATYNNALYLEERLEMLNWWANYVKKASKFSIF